MNNNDKGTNMGLLSLSPILVFTFFYLGVSIVAGDFYKLPVSVAFIVASVWALSITPGKFASRIEIFSKGAANSDILYMVWIFILAGAFALLAEGIGSIEATVKLTLGIIPAKFVLPGLFITACFVSLSIGTSVGTVTALIPLAVEMAEAGGGAPALFVAVALCGSFFGDNLSFISDTTIASTRTQGCKMRDKFRENIKIALPAAVGALVLYYFAGSGFVANSSLLGQDTNSMLMLPYLAVIVLALCGVNVILVLLSGILSCIVLGLFYGYGFIEMCGFMGTGIEGMGSLITVTLLSAGLLAVIEYNGGITFLINWLMGKVSGKRMAQYSIALLVGSVNVCTANNTIAILTVGNLSRAVSEKFGIDPRKTASILDTGSCIVQSVIPYGAQMLLATGLAGISPFSLYEYMYYPALLALMLFVSVMIKRSPRQCYYGN